MIHYEIDFTINGESHHTGGESTFPSDANYDKHNYTYEDIVNHANNFISAYMKLGRMKGCVNPDSIKVVVSKI